MRWISARRRRGVSCVAAVALIAASASAQQGGGLAYQVSVNLGPGVQMAFYGKSQLLNYAPVWDELKLTPEQRAQLRKIETQEDERAQQRKEERMKQQYEIRQEPDPQLRANLEANARQMQIAMIEKLQQDSEAARLKVLDRRQRARLDQIQIQVDGPMAFRRPENQRRLNLDPTQIEAIDEIVAAGMNETIQLAVFPEALRPVPGASREQRTALQKTKAYKDQVAKSRESALGVRGLTTQRILRILTRRQREAYQKMRGEPFKASSLRAPDALATSQPAKEAKAP